MFWGAKLVQEAYNTWNPSMRLLHMDIRCVCYADDGLFQVIFLVYITGGQFPCPRLKRKDSIHCGSFHG